MDKAEIEGCSLAVLGLYSSGSTALAAVLDGLGVHMGDPYYFNDGECFYEPDELGKKLRLWWKQPEGEASSSEMIRRGFLRRWRQKQVPGASGYVGAKHPLLTLSATDLEVSWGRDTRWIRAGRDLDNSIASLKKRNWGQFRGKEEFLQRKLWQSVEEFLSNRNHLHIEFEDLIADPKREVRRIVEFLEIEPSIKYVETAVARVNYPG